MCTFWDALLTNIDHRSYKGAKTFGSSRLPHSVSNTETGAKNSSANSRSSYSKQWQGKTSALREAVSIWQLGFGQVDELQFGSAGTLSYFKWYLSSSTIPTAQTHIPYQQQANVTRPSPTKAWLLNLLKLTCFRDQCYQSHTTNISSATLLQWLCHVILDAIKKGDDQSEGIHLWQ